MNKVQRAVIMAAGMGKRMQPLTLTTPKPLVEVHGKKMIESVIDALHLNGIGEIYVVVGYLKEQFDFLEKKYQGLKLVTNPYFDTCNNISSLYVARNFLTDAIILDGDQIICDASVFHPEFGLSGYNAVWVENETKEWLMQVDERRIVTSCSRTGGKGGWQLFSVSRWNKEDGMKLKKYVELEFFEKNNRQIYWDDIAMFEHFSDFKLGIYPMKSGAVIEIDSINELVALDASYKVYGEKS